MFKELFTKSTGHKVICDRNKLHNSLDMYVKNIGLDYRQVSDTGSIV